MHISSQPLQALEALLKSFDIDLFLLPMGDEFQNEYTPESSKRLPFITGFSGSAGLGAFWANPTEMHRHTLFVDGRYILQAPQQVHPSIAVLNSGESSLSAWLKSQKTSSPLRVGYDPWLITHQQRTSWQAALPAIQWVPVTPNPVDSIWHDRPAMPAGETILHPVNVAGKTYPEKRDEILSALVSANADAQLLTLPDGINWLLNLRGSDIPFNPLLLCYFLLRADGSATLFTHTRSFSESVRTYFTEQNIEVMDIEEIWHNPIHALRHPGAGRDPSGKKSTLAASGTTILIDPANASDAWWNLAEQHHWKLIAADDPTLLAKACKNPVELAGIKAAHQRDGLALCKFLCWLDHQVEDKELPTELQIATKLDAFRLADASYRGPSFDTIAGSGPNGAIVHYRADTQSNRRLRLGELLLLDSGGQYTDGTTDITRTIAIGTPSAAMREHFTLVLKGHIALATAIFPAGTTGAQLDVLARQFLWAKGLDYDHGTGHGVGAYLCVHEGPQRISKRGSSVALKPGMVISNEPGYYKAGAYGIRIESLVAVVATSQATLTFETLSLAPIDTRLIDPTMLTNEEHNWLNQYHRHVYTIHAPTMEPQERAWLSHATRAI